jgi:hypothetical protein
MKYPKLKPGVFLFDRTTGFIIQIIYYSAVIRDSGEVNTLYITRPTRSLADACIDSTELRIDNIHEFLHYVRSQKLLTVINDKVYSLVSTATLVDTSKPDSHKFLRKDSFFEDYRVDEKWAEKNKISLTVTWRHFSTKGKWDCNEVGAINFKMFTTRVGPQNLVKAINEILNSGVTQLFRTTLGNDGK